ncbi:retrovirus-related pol polyprotein from transposon TNT 1-94 [Tanacetum coccineum]
MNTKFDKSQASGILLYVTPLPKNITKKSIPEVNADRNSNVNKALFTTPVEAKSKNLGATSKVAKSRLSVANTPKAINKRMLEAYDWQSSTAKKFRLGHNLFLVGQFYDGDLEVAFHSNTCYVWNLEGDDLLTGSRDLNLYTISIFEMAASSPVCLISKATSIKSWLWHCRLSHLYFGAINQLMSKDLVDGLLKFKYNKDHLCSACEQDKSKKASLPSKLVPSTESKLELLHMDFCRPMRVASINGKKYILVIVDDYSRYTWVYFLRTKDEAPDIIIDFVNQVQRNLDVLGTDPQVEVQDPMESLEQVEAASRKVTWCAMIGGKKNLAAVNDEVRG